MGLNRNIGQPQFQTCKNFIQRIDTVLRKGGAAGLDAFITDRGFRLPPNCSFAAFYRFGEVFSLGLKFVDTVGGQFLTILLNSVRMFNLYLAVTVRYATSGIIVLHRNPGCVERSYNSHVLSFRFNKQ